MEVYGLHPSTGEVLVVKREPTTHQDSNAVAVLKVNETVGHVAPRLFTFLKKGLK